MTGSHPNTDNRGSPAPYIVLRAVIESTPYGFGWLSPGDKVP